MSGNPSMKANLPLNTKPVRPNQGGGMSGNPPVDNSSYLIYQLKVSNDFARYSAEHLDMMNLYDMEFKDYEKNKAGLLQHGFDRYLDMLVGKWN